MKFAHSVISYLQSIFALDTRSLALLRILIWCIIIWDLLIWLQFLAAFHTDVWLLPKSVLLSNYQMENIWSMHSISSSYWYQLVLWWWQMIIAIMFVIGHKTQAMTILLWILTLSLHWHNPLILNWWDTVVRLILFWGMFLPLGHQRSLDNNKYKNIPISVFSIATVGYVLQVCFIYIFATILKDHPRWTTDFTAVYYSLSLEPFVTSIWSWVYNYPELMKWLTIFSYYLEWYGLFLLLIPWKNHFRRILCIALFVMFHIWLGLTMKLYSFPYIMVWLWLALVPAGWWDKLMRMGWKNIDTINIATTIHIQKLHPLISGFLILCLVYIFSRNLRSTDFDKYDDWFPTDINRFWFLFRIDQYWNMFAPYPFVDDGRVVIEGKKQNWESINLISPESEYTLDKPGDMWSYYPHERRRKYYTSMWMKKNSDYRQYGANYHCYTWNTAHPDDPISSIKRYYMLERTLEDYETRPIEEVVLYEWTCTI